ncbi:MAG: basic amino acid ABC transporter substrate-binding protein [Chloroflexota bacterium]|jgi:polar amino acid transport system substrate-binding protein|nr:basic amino acid ABC transporter substrate-binding protein [Chloroflexota bacterium]
MKKNYLFSLIAILMLSLLASCTQKSDELVVATDATFPPFEYIEEDSKDIVGFDIDLMNAIAEKADLDIVYKNVAWDPLLAGMADCQYDMAISAMTITAARAEQFSFSDPYINAGQIVAVQIDNETIAGPDDLPGKTVGAQLGTTGAMEIEAIEDTTLKVYDTYELAFLDLANGQIDAVVADYPLAVAFVSQNADSLKLVGEVFTDENYGIAFCKGNTELIEKVNAALADLKDEGLIDELVQEWYTVTD